MPLSRREFFARLLTAPPDRATAPAYTPNERFFRVYSRRPPRLRAEFWALSIGGMARHPFSLSYDDLLALPAQELACTVLCAANPPGGERIGHARWRGVPVSALLDELDIDPAVSFARLEAAGGHRTVVRYADLQRGLLAYAMNGTPLPTEQGFPARLVIPGLADHKQPRWIERIELWDAPGAGGLWEQRGWPLAGDAPTVSAITSPRPLQVVSAPVRLQGYAFAGLRPIIAVELSIDGGSWVPAPFVAAAPSVWSRWQVDWPAPGPGDYRVSVRASDADGFTQTEATTGASAIHTMTIQVREGAGR